MSLQQLEGTMLLLASNNYARENSAVVVFLKKVIATGSIKKTDVGRMKAWKMNPLAPSCIN